MFAACQPPPDAAKPAPADTAAAPAETASPPAVTAPASAVASGALAKLEGSRKDVLDGATEIAERGDDATKQAAAPILVKRLRAMREPAFREELRPTIEKANALSNLSPTPEQVEAQLRQYQEEEVIQLVKVVAKIGGPAITAYLVDLAQEKEASRELRRAVLVVLEPLQPTLDPSVVAALDSERKTLRGPAGAVAVGEASVAGGTVANANTVVAGMAAGFRRCFNKGLQEDPAMKGTVRVTAKIGKGGEVVSATPSASGTLSKTVVDCVSARISSAQFSPPVGGLATLVIPVSMTPE